MDENDYKTVISENFVATVYYRGEEVWQSRAFRIYDQAERAAREWIDQNQGVVRKGDIDLDVQSLAVDADTIFGRL